MRNWAYSMGFEADGLILRAFELLGLSANRLYCAYLFIGLIVNYIIIFYLIVI